MPARFPTISLSVSRWHRGHFFGAFMILPLLLGGAVILIPPIGRAAQPAVGKSKLPPEDPESPFPGATEKDVDELRKLLYNLDPGIRRQAATTLGRLGQAAKAAIPDLIKQLLASDDIYGSVSEALIQIGRDSLPPLLTSLRNANATQRVWFYFVLGRLYRDGDTQVEKVLFAAILEDRADLPRCAAISAVARDSRIKRAIPLLVNVVADQNAGPKVRGCAAWELSHFGIAASDAIPHLRHILDHRASDTQFRVSATKGIGGVGASDRKVAEYLRRILVDKSEEAAVRCCAAEGLGASDFGQMAVADLIDILRQESRRDNLRIQICAAEGLARLRPHVNDLPILLSIIESPDSPNRMKISATKAIGQLGPEAKAVVPRLLLAIERDPDIGILDEGATECFFTLRRTLGDPAAVIELRRLLASRIERAARAPRTERLARQVEALIGSVEAKKEDR
jgi:HEAT repeat protein